MRKKSTCYDAFRELVAGVNKQRSNMEWAFEHRTEMISRLRRNPYDTAGTLSGLTGRELREILCDEE